jgi:hypothetical protein
MWRNVLYKPLRWGGKTSCLPVLARGGERAEAIYSLISSAKLNGIEPKVYLRFVIGRIADHPVNRIADPLALWAAAR